VGVEEVLVATWFDVKADGVERWHFRPPLLFVGALLYAC
jgi:hypothetical protein